MRILLLHNHYGSEAPSGENRVFEMELEMLRRHGHEVEVVQRQSDAIREQGIKGLAIGAASTPWNISAAEEIKRKVESFRPNITHAHNTFPLLSPAVFSAAKGSARVLTLHNYRLLCAAGIPMREGRTCTECIDNRSVMPAMHHGCYRGSRLATLPLASKIFLHRKRGTWLRDVESFIALSEFQKELMSKGGLPIDRIEVKPNFYPNAPKRIAFDRRPRRIVFVGRLGEEKGVKDLVDAWRIWGADAPELRIIGDGPLREALKVDANDIRQITFTGQLGSRDAEAEIAQGRLLVVPSRWFEGFPMVLREAFAHGVATAVSDIGPLPDIVSKAMGAIFPAGSARSLASCLMGLWQNQELLKRMGEASKTSFDELYSEPKNYDMLLDIYDRAIFRAKRV